MTASPCPVCRHPAPRPVVRRPQVPVHQNLVCRTADSARAVARGDLELRCCPGCGFVFNAAFDAAKLSYGEDYENLQAFSPAFSRHMDALVERVVREGRLDGRRLVEVGCGQGDFLRRLLDRAGPGTRAWGFDPSYRGADAERAGRLRFERRFYGPDCSDVAADVVICRHVIEHEPDPVALLSAVRQALSPGARLFFETPCIDWILANHVIWDLFYEHCSYFNARSLTTAFQQAGFHVREVQRVFDDQYLWLEAELGEQPPAVSCDPAGIPIAAERFAAAEQELRLAWAATLDRLTADGGRVALWGAGAKGCTLANLIDADGRLFDCLVDINPGKQGHHVPGTGHPIVAPEALAGRGITAVILTNPNYRTEIRALLARMGLDLTVVEAPENQPAGTVQAPATGTR